ncbi:hypothetical protein CRYUN_Cryun05aG0245200 [Craigia yunnanensis]
MVKSSWKPSVEGDSGGRVMPIVCWEDQSQLESGPLSSSSSGPYGTFIGEYDGHGGAEAPRFINDNLFRNLKSFASEHQEISINVLRKAFSATEENFLSLVRKQWLGKPQMASVGSCCLTGVICNGLLYIANVGDSRVVLGRSERGTKEVIAVQLSTEHNASIDEKSFGHCILMIHRLL